MPAALPATQRKGPRRCGCRREQGRRAEGEGRMEEGRRGEAGREGPRVYDMRSLSSALEAAKPGVGEVSRILTNSSFRPRLPGLTKLVSRLSRDGQSQKAQEIFESLQAMGLKADTTITNAAISACDRGGQWEKALQIFHMMDKQGLTRDTITYSSVISALSKGKQCELAIETFNHMMKAGIQPDAVTCCSLIAALDKGGMWEMAEQVFVSMYAGHPKFRVLLLMVDTNNPNSSQAWTNQLMLPWQSSGVLSLAANSCPVPVGLMSRMGAGRQSNSDSCMRASTPPPDFSHHDPFAGAAPGNGRFGRCLTAPARPWDVEVTDEEADDANASNIRQMLSMLAIGDQLGCPTDQLGCPCPGSPFHAMDFGNPSPVTPPSTPPLAHPSPLAAASAGPSPATRRPAPQGTLSRSVSPPTHLLDTPTASFAAIPAASSGSDHSEDGHLAGPTLSAHAASWIPDAQSSPALLGVGDRPAAGQPGALRSVQSDLTDQMASFPLDGGIGGCAATQNGMHRAHSTLAPSQSASLSMPPQWETPASSSFPLDGRQQAVNDALRAVSPPSPGGALVGLYPRAPWMRSRKATPNRVCCNALLAAYARAKPAQWQKAQRLLQLMWECGGEVCPDIVSYNTVMKACGNAQKLDTAFQLYHSMRMRGLEPSIATYGTLIAVASEAQRCDRVIEVWEWLQQSGMEPNIACANSFLSALEKAGQWSETVRVFGELLDSTSRLKPNAVTFNIVMTGLIRRGQADKVEHLFDQMCSFGLEPSAAAYNTLIGAHVQMGNWRRAVDVLHHIMRASSPVQPTLGMYNQVLAAMHEGALSASQEDGQRIGELARLLLQRMAASNGAQPDAVTFSTVASLLQRVGSAQLAEDVGRLMNGRCAADRAEGGLGTTPRKF
eukprot:evm.model.scf_32EXC.4 EVM.evm.TU.scf_32EXC.4   scf_32EXC:118782-128291(-)